MPRLTFASRVPVVLGFTLVLGFACARPPGDNAAASEALTGPEWTLVELEGDSAITGAPDGTPTIRFTSGDSLRVGGSTGCNSYGGTYEASGTTLRLDQLVSTLRACADSAANEQGSRFMSALQRADGYRIENRQLVLLAGSQPIARFERADAR